MPVKSIALAYTEDVHQWFSQFQQLEHAILLDSGKPWQKQSRYDIFSAQPTRSLSINIDGECFESNTSTDFHTLQNLLKSSWLSESSALPFCGGWLGFASYELGAFLHPEMGMCEHSGELPLFWAGYYNWAVVIDHQEQQANLIHEVDIDEGWLADIKQRLTNKTISNSGFALTSPMQQRHSEAHYQKAIARIKNYLESGDCYQVNFTQEFFGQYQGDCYQAFLKLRKQVPSPNMAFIRYGEHCIVSISPEQFLSAERQQVISKPIKGTAARIANKQQDQAAANELKQSVKNRAENLMIVDLIRNDLSRFSLPNSVKTTELFSLQSFSNVHHLVSQIEATLKDEYNIWDVFFASFPGGSITGTPKVRACQVIHELEAFNREIYCGSIFYASNNGNFDANIAIRTLLFAKDTLKAWAGGGIVIDSIAEQEYQECFDKIQTLLDALN